MDKETPASDILIHFHHGRVERVKLKRTYPSFLDGDDFVEHNNTGGPRHVPGIHVAVNFERLPSIQFSHGFGAWKQDRLSWQELAMIQLMNDITEEKNWCKNVADFDQVQRWKQAATSRFNLDSNLWDWCLFELTRKAAECSEKSPSILALDSASRVYKSDHLKEAGLFGQLTKDTRGRSICPWLYPFIYAGSPIRTDARVVRLDNVRDCIGGGTVPPKPFWDNDRCSGEADYYSATFQWLAADLQFTGDSVKFSSLINNLHPLKHKPLYAAIEAFISESLSSWNRVLLYKSLQRNGPRIKPQRKQCKSCIDNMSGCCCCTIELNNFAQWSRGNTSPGTMEPPEDRNWSALSAMDGLYTNSQRLYDNVSLSQAFADRGLQVYVELSNLELCADGSMSQESSHRLQWSLNGNRNERIVATSLICLRRENIRAESGQISFRTETKPRTWSSSVSVPNGETGARAEGQPALVSGTPVPPPFQKLLTINLPTGRTITFPNALQHKFEPLTLDDASEPGSLQFLAVHLVDPHYILCSTRHVPPQSVAWWWEAAKLGFVFCRHKIPTELRRLIANYAIGRGFGHAMQDDESEDEDEEHESGGDGDDEAGGEEDGGQEDGGEEDETDEDADGDPGNQEDGNGESGEPEASWSSRFARDNSPEKPQEERPIRIEAAIRMREKALEEHAAVMHAVNNLRVYGVDSCHRAWFRKTASTSVPLDHGGPEQGGHPTVNAAVAADGNVIPAPEKDESDYEGSGYGESDDEESDEERDDDGADDEQNGGGPTFNQADEEQGSPSAEEDATEQEIAAQLSGERPDAAPEPDEYDDDDSQESARTRDTSEEAQPRDQGESSRGVVRRRSEEPGDFDRIQRRRL